MGAPKYDAIRRRVQADQSAKNARLAVSEAPKFPDCRGMFDFCPSEEELKNSLSKKIAPNRCGRCAIYEESGRPYPTEKRKIEIDDTFLKAFGKKDRL